MKGTNTTISEAKSKLVNTINEIIRSGVPITVVEMMIDLVSYEVKNNVQSTLAQEEKLISEQVEWVEPTSDEKIS